MTEKKGDFLMLLDISLTIDNAIICNISFCISTLVDDFSSNQVESGQLPCKNQSLSDVTFTVISMTPKCQSLSSNKANGGEYFHGSIFAV